MPDPTRVVHFQSPEYHSVPESGRLYIGRHPDPHIGRWGNPYGPESRRHLLGSLCAEILPDEEVLPAYRRYVESRPDLMAELPSLQGKVLGCWCRPQPKHDTHADLMYCHGQVLIAMLQDLGGEPIAQPKPTSRKMPPAMTSGPAQNPTGERGLFD